VKSVDRRPDDRPAQFQQVWRQFVGQHRLARRIYAIDCDPKGMVDTTPRDAAR
jgi:hypothetical protein